MKTKSILPLRILGNRVLIAVKPPELHGNPENKLSHGDVVSFGFKKSPIIYAEAGAFGNRNFREAVIVQVGDKVSESLQAGDRVCWNGAGGQAHKGMLVVSVLDIEFVIP